MRYRSTMPRSSEPASERILMRIAGRTQPLSLSQGRGPSLQSASSGWRGVPFEVHLMHPVHRRVPVETGPLAGEFGLLVVLDGEIELHARDEGRLSRSTGRAGSIAVLSGDAPRRFERVEGHACVAAVNIAPAWLERAELTGRLQRMSFVHDETVRGLVGAMQREVRSGSTGGAALAESLSLGVLSHVVDHYGTGARAPARVRGQLTASQRERLREHVRASLASDLSLARLSAEVGVSPRHFVTLFRRAFGTTPHRYVLEQRIEAGERLIACGERDLAAVALATGFSSQSHFTTAFRAARGTTPARFARSAR